ncbi:hypothetical protein HanRHA438_Chr17g0806911 [Helianthus annuus]|uniref:Uncharacterized protein n=1 Tax=Helianthus annuus TaxID=4232 RepID=A0A251RNQ2_HELAN|nr:hypothetical protein HanXRQr2_Chr17g0796871 [Helianthus annuus]KAJ0428738.1 hypothetical protein HanHA300_Chr17g0649481 [Helianthus annuus]KAJ0432905.1 hypothetical protein HanIR_Chr17g0864431 [Helianthus annuus]KAJ0447072.1 hypothetical protein HanHA89_Chr17g0701281 [Helianthus annuus]KAJ0631978.1 hypothetical protein HanLR1_Chr17g0659961 [Helianthus annuus]
MKEIRKETEKGSRPCPVCVPERRRCLSLVVWWWLERLSVCGGVGFRVRFRW